MDAVFLPEVSTGAQRSPNRVVEPRIRCHGGEQTTSRTVSQAGEATIRHGLLRAPETSTA